MINFYKTQDEAKKEKNIANFLRVTFLDEWNRNANNGMLKMNMLRITKLVFDDNFKTRLVIGPQSETLELRVFD